jgi:hypothetical protein
VPAKKESPMGSGHISYFMKQHHNLYKFSQQGWESLNEKFKLIFFSIIHSVEEIMEIM